MKHNRSNIFSSLFIICKCNYIVAVFLFLGAILFNSITACALNEDYLDESKWSESTNVTSVVLNKKSNNCTLSGVFKYYVDNDNANLYLYFSITESSINVYNNDVKINISAEAGSESYTFSIDKDGICDALDEEEKLFEVKQNFGYYSTTDSGLYIAGIHPDIQEKLIIKINLYVNGHKYIIADNITAQSPEEATTIKSANTTNSKSNKADTTDELSNKVGTTASTTKFSGAPAPTQPSAHIEATINDEYSEDATEYADTENEPATENTNESKITLSQAAKICLSIGAASALFGVMFLVLSLIAKQKENQNNS